MNLRCQPILLIMAIAISILSGCVKNDSDPCGSQGVHIHFYSHTICETDTLYPEDIQKITYGLFDRSGVLVDYRESANVQLDKDYYQTVEISNGLYTVIAWSGLTVENYILSELQTGVTTKNDIFFRLRRDNNRAYSIAGTRVFYGESDAIYIDQNESPEPEYEDVTVNLQELTNRITIIVEGLDPVEDFDISLEIANGAMTVGGVIAKDDVIVCGVEYQRTKDILEAYFTVLKLETGRDNTIVIRNIVTGAELFRGSLLGTLLLKNPEVNLACDHDFVIRFTTEDQCDCGEYIIQEIRVNNWLVHSYQKEM